MTVVLFNGPPYSGKDTVVDYFVKLYNPTFKSYKFSAPLKDGIASIFQLNKAQVNLLEDTKEVPNDLLMGLSYRQAQIWLSEEVMKPKFGKTIFGKIALNNMSMPRVYLVSDSGFMEEAKTIVESLEHKVILIRIKRPGYDFTNDSRSYWENTLGIKDYVVTNDSTIANLVEQISYIFKKEQITYE